MDIAIKMKLLILCLFMSLAAVNAQDVSLYVYDVVTDEDYLQDGEAEVKIYISSSVPIYSYSFTLEGFDNVLSANSTSIQPDCLAWSFFGGDNVNILENYFYGGGTNGNVIPIVEDGEFLSIIATYNPVLDDEDPYYLTFDEVLPGVNGNGTNFFTYNESEGVPELVEHTWIPRTWMIGENQTYDYIGQDCAGEIWGLANWDDCALCTGGNTNFDYNYYLDCAGVCFGDSESDDFGDCCIPNEEGDFSLWFIDSDGDGFGETTGADQEECELLGGTFDSGLCTATACYAPDGFVGNSDDNDIGCDGVYDECGVCDSDPSNNSFYISETNFGGAYDCTGECYGTTQLLYWFPDCDFDGLADNNNSEPVCGEPTNEDFSQLCPDGGNIISIDPNNHTFDPHINCTSNQVDDCGSCDGVGPDCRETCSPNAPLSVDCSQNGYGWGPELSLAVESLEIGAQDTIIFLEEGCRPYVGYESNFNYSHDNGVDVCGQCYVADLDESLQEYQSNYSCSGCADMHAENYDDEALFDDGSCSFQLYAGDVNRDGVVDELDLDGIAQFWNYWTDNERAGASILWFPQFTQDDYWYDPAGEQSSSSCAMFADADGDAIVNSGDISAVLLNWGKEVSETYYYPWGPNGDDPNCLSYNFELFRENYEQIYDYIIENYPYNSENQDAIEYLASLLDIEIESNFIPDGFKVHQNFPNPFNPSTRFPVEINKESNVTLRIYDIAGKKIYEQKVDNMLPGVYDSNSPLVWEAHNFSSGIYVYSIELSTGEIDFNKLMLIK